MSSRYPTPRWCPVCACRTMEPDAEPGTDWVWTCTLCGYTEYEGAATTSEAQRSWLPYFIARRPWERAEWIEQYHLEGRPEWQTRNPQDDPTSPGQATPRPAWNKR